MKRMGLVAVVAFASTVLVMASDPGASALPPTDRIALQVTGRAGVPADAEAVVLNVTVTTTDDAGYVTVWPCGAPPPEASNLNFTAGQTIANLVIARVGASGQVCLQASSPADLIADLAGHVPAGSGFTPLAVPARVLDTRAGRPTLTVPAHGVVELQVSGVAGVPREVSAVAANVTVTNPTDAGYVTVWPCDVTRPEASNLNFTAGETIPNLVISAVAGDGRICFYSSATTELIADVAGHFGAGSGYSPLVPTRLLDTRGTTVAAGSTVELPVTGRGGVPASASAVVLNTTAVNAAEAGFVTAFPCGTPLPDASNLNYTSGQTIANLVTVRVGAGGAVCLYSSATVDLLADVAGAFPTGSDFAPAASPTRLLDTRQRPAPSPPSTAPPAADPPAPTPPSGGCVDINTADRDALQGIIHIGPALAEQIIALRADRPFSSVTDLIRVRGIAQARLGDIISQGLACT